MTHQAIQTHFIGQSNHKPLGVKATAQDGSLTFPGETTGSVGQNHINAARKLAQHYGWHGYWYGGILPNGDYVFVQGPSAAPSEADFYLAVHDAP
jgi:hypothetical protein